MSQADLPVTTSAVSDEQLVELRSWNRTLVLLHLLQATTILVLARDLSLPVTTAFAEVVPGPTPGPMEVLFRVPVGLAVAAFLGLAGFNHLIAWRGLRGVYERDLRRGVNRLRWLEYAVSSTFMVLLIALLVGVHDATALVAVGGANAAALLFGWVLEEMNPPGRSRVTMLPFWLGAVAATMPWLAILLSLVGAKEVPGYILGVVAVQLVLFSGFAANAWLHLRKVGEWRDYAYTERTYQLLSLLSKSMMAWQIFLATLVGGGAD